MYTVRIYVHDGRVRECMRVRARVYVCVCVCVCVYVRVT